MNRNYTYIIASLPPVRPDSRPEGDYCKSTLEWIASQLDAPDRARMQLVCDGFDPSRLDMDFYRKALSDKESFVREFFSADIRLRNAKVDYLNKELGRTAGKGRLEMEVAENDNDNRRIAGIFETADLLEREKAIDSFLWDKAEELTMFQDFSMGKVLEITIKLCIIDRWISLDHERGCRMLRKLLSDMRGTYGNIEFDR